MEWLLVARIGFWTDGGGGEVEPGKCDAVCARARPSNVHPLQKQCLGTPLLEWQTSSLGHTAISKQVLMGAEANYLDQSCNLLSKKRKVEAEGR